MLPRIEILPTKKLIGRRLKMSLSADRTPELWRSFMMERKNITNNVSADLYSMQVYDHSIDFKDLTPETDFEKWAATEVVNFDSVPDGMETYTLNGGLYAVFIYKGLPADFDKSFQYIFYTWLPNSVYELDRREHFELLGEKYKNNSPESEEEIWIPIKLK